MARERDLLQFHLLDLVAETGGPVGAATLLQRVFARGIDVSQATVGRALRVLDDQGYTVRLTNKGRILTAEGRHWLASARYRRETRRWTHETLTVVGQSTLTELRQSMVARKALERAIVRLTAECASPSEIAELGRIVAGQRDDLSAGGRGAEEAVAFHVALANICGNRFLVAAVNLVRSSSEALENLMYHLGATVGHSCSNHAAVVEAVAMRDPDAAERAMVAHMDELIRQIDVLLTRLSDGASLPEPGASDDDGLKSNSEGTGVGRTVRPAELGLDK